MLLSHIRKKESAEQDQSIILNKFIALIRELNKIDKGTLADINNLVTDNLVRERQYYKYSKLLN
jgi:hypothetical protein